MQIPAIIVAIAFVLLAIFLSGPATPPTAV